MKNKKSKKEITNDMVEQALNLYRTLLAAVPDDAYNMAAAVACGRLFARFIAAAASSQTSAMSMILESTGFITKDVMDFCEEFKKPIHTKMSNEES